MRSSAHAVAASFAVVVASLMIQPASAAPVISEILYRPGTGFPENTALEYIEVHNPDAAAVDVSGWAFRSGVSYTIPAGTYIAAGGYLVVAASPAAVNASFGSTGALGPWTAGATLSNNGEKITLSKPGTPAGTWSKVDEVSYASEGDWAQRFRETAWNGWDWATPANGGGKSMELRNPAVSNDNGQNWTASTATAGGTPGAPNTASTSNVPPIIHSVKHSPAVPTSTQSVTVSCVVNDEAAAASRTATLFYRNATGTNPGAFLSVAMTNDGTGKCTAVLAPSGTDKVITEFYISSTDGAATRTWPAATTEGQNANCQYQADNEVPATTADTYRLTLTAAENSAFQSVSSSSDRQFNQTLIVTRGSESDIRYRSAMRIRGNSSRSYTFKPLRVSIPNDASLDGFTSFNLNPKASYLQYFGMRLFQAGGLPATGTIGVELRRNGVEYTTSGGSTPDYGRWVRMDDLNAKLVDDQWPAANSGNLYKKGRPDEFWRSTTPAPSNPDGLLDGWSKQNNSSANDWSDLTGFFSRYQSIAAPHFPGAPAGNAGAGTWNRTPFDENEMVVLETVADTQQWARWFAMMTFLQSNETNISNGQDDDYSAYFLPSAGGQRRMQLLPHDLDTIFGMGDTPLSPTDRGLYDSTEQGSVFATLFPLMGTSSSTGNAGFRTRYHNAIREMCGSVLSDSTFPAFVDYHLADWAPASVRTSMKNFASARCSYLLGLIGAPAIPPAAATATGTLTQAHGALIISEILAANTAAHLNGGTYPDVIEIQNTGASPADLGGKSLSNDPLQPQNFVFAAGTTLASGARLVVYADADFAAPGLHTGFVLDKSGAAIYLYDSPGDGGAVLDSVTFGPQATDFSIGRTADLTTWALGNPSIGAANNVVGAMGAPGALRINEWLGNPDFRVSEDFLEIHNSTALPVVMGGMFLTDDFRNYPTQHVLPALTFIGPGEFHVYKAKGSLASPSNPSELPFSIDSTFGGLALIGANGAIADRVDVLSQRRDQSTGRSPDSSGNPYVTYAVPSPGITNGPLPAAYQALLDNLRITEFIYKPNGGSDFEFIELLNIGTGTLNLSGVRFTNGIDYTFPPGTTLGPGAFKVVARSQSTLISRFPAVAPVLAPGQFTGSLDNNGETIALSLPSPWDIAILNFVYKTTWEPLTASAGYSLTAVDAIASAPRDWNERETWTVSIVVNGTPGSDGPPGINSPLSASGIAGDPFSYQITAIRAPSQFDASGLPAGLSVNTASGLISGTPTQSGTFNVSISASNTAGADTETLNLTIATSGPLHHFTWDHTTTSAEAGVPFPAWISARDQQGRNVSAYNGTGSVTGTGVGGVSTATVVITEVTDEAYDEFELQNTGSTAVNTSGWFVVIGNSDDSVNTVRWSLPATVAPGETLRVAESTAPPLTGRLAFGGGISWSASLNRGYVMLFDGTTTLKDFFVWGWTTGELLALSITVNTRTITTAGQWSGAGILPGSRATGNNSWQRIGTKDNNSAADWVWAANATSWSATNTGLTIPWSGGAAITVSPSSIAFTGGVFAGFLTIPTPATGVLLTAADAQSHSGQSALFDVVTAQPDTDGDKMPDAWESANGLNPAVDDATDDLDTDGLTNRNEYYAGTDPRSEFSSLLITSWSANPPTQVSLSWNAAANRLYRVRYAPDLANWSYVPGQIYVPAAAGTGTATFAPLTGNATRAFYRVELLTPP